MAWQTGEFFENLFAFCSLFRDDYLKLISQHWRLLMDAQKELIAEFEREVALTRKVLAALPEDVDFGWKPHEKSFTIGRLAGHVAETPCQWALHTLQLDKLAFGPDHKFESYVPKSTTALLELYDKESAEALAALATLDPAKWDDNWKMVAMGQTWIDDTRYRVWRTWVLNHMVHHRAQLMMDLRLLNQKVPGVYGPSADEM
jgi:uncharacterized damage-inducible protein DinB